MVSEILRQLTENSCFFGSFFRIMRETAHKLTEIRK